MPFVYDYMCPSCGEIENVTARLEEENIDCPKGCGHKAFRLFSPPRSKPICDIEPYFDVNLGRDGGTYVTSRRHKKRLLREQHLEIKG